MRSGVLALGLALAAGSAFAHPGETDNYNKSVFQGFERLKASRPGLSMHTHALVQQQFPGWMANADKLTGKFRNIFGNAQPVPGASITDKVQYLLQQKLTALGLNPSEWVQVASQDAPNAHFVRFEQRVAGRQVLFASLQFRFTRDGRIQQIEQKDYGNPVSNLLPAITQNAAATSAVSDIQDVQFSSVTASTDWQWMPKPGAGGYEIRPVWPVQIVGRAEKSGLPVKLRAYVDAITGDVLYRYNEVREIDRTVKGVVYKQNPLVAATSEPLPDLYVQVGGSQLTTDANGFYSSSSLTAPINATMALAGLWSKVIDDASGITPSYVDTITVNNGGVYTYPTSTQFPERFVNAYYHTTRAHDHMKTLLPNFSGMDFQLPTNVDVGTTNCNAFYNGSSINFLPAGGGCNSFAICGDIIYHEYGHGISDNFYTSQNTFFQNGGLGEGNSDIWGMTITKDPVLGKGAYQGGGGGLIRRYDQAPKVYPQDLTGEVHDNGEIIAGAWWDVGVNMNNVDSMAQLFALTYYNLPNGPNGTEGQVYYDVLIAALLNDDNDANLTNGTPHVMEIVTAFARHGIYLLAEADVVHNEVTNQPLNTPVPVVATVAVGTPAFLNGVNLVYKARTASAWDTLQMTTTGGTTYSATIPGQADVSIIDYHFIVRDIYNVSDVRFPAGFTTLGSLNQRNIPYQFGVGLYLSRFFDFEAPLDTAWKVGNVSGDNATSGKWIQAKPIGSTVSTSQGTIQIQPATDHTFGNATGQCLVTGNANSPTSPASTADVDGGKTTVLTPVFDLSQYQRPVIEYYRWFSNNYGSNPGDDNLQIQVKSVTSSIWRDVDYTMKADERWRRRIFFVSQYIQNPTQIQMRFIAQDQGNPTLVEVAVDDLFIYDDNTSTNVGDVKAAQASIYPNPANQSINISLPQGRKGSIQLYDITGKLLLSQDMNPTQLQYLINTEALASGTYVVSIKTDAFIQTRQVIVKH